MPHVRTESLDRVRLRKDAELPDCTDLTQVITHSIAQCDGVREN